MHMMFHIYSNKKPRALQAPINAIVEMKLEQTLRYFDGLKSILMAFGHLLLIKKMGGDMVCDLCSPYLCNICVLCRCGSRS